MGESEEVADPELLRTSLRPMPAHVLGRTASQLRRVELALEMMSDPDPDRKAMGFVCVAVFGRAVTSALQNLRTFDRVTFDRWYAPWVEEMSGDELCKFFYRLRTRLLKDITPTGGVVLNSFGVGAPPPGTLTMDTPLPALHRGLRIADQSLPNLSRMYHAYLDEMFRSAAPIVNEVTDRWLAANVAKVNGRRSD